MVFKKVVIVRFIVGDYSCRYVYKVSFFVEEENFNCCEVKFLLEYRDYGFV